MNTEFKKITVYIKNLFFCLLGNFVMSKKNKTKKVASKPCLSNPLTEKLAFKFPTEEAQILELLPNLLKEIFPPPLDRKQMLQEVFRDKDENPWSLPKEERRSRIKSWTSEKKEKAPKEHLKKDIVTGFRSCLRLLRRDELELLLFDRDFTLENLSMLLTSANCAVISVSGLSDMLVETIGFPSTMMALKKMQNYPENWTQISKMASSLSDKQSASLPTLENVSKESQKVETEVSVENVICEANRSLLLKRKNDRERVFHPYSSKRKKQKIVNLESEQFLKLEDSSVSSSCYIPTKMAR